MVSFEMDRASCGKLQNAPDVLRNIPQACTVFRNNPQLFH